MSDGTNEAGTDSVAKLARARGIEEIVHFTTDRGLYGMLMKRALVSRARVEGDPDLEFVFSAVWPVRVDLDWLDYVSLSITEINTELYEKAFKNLPERWWGIAAFDVEILDDDGVTFTTTNNKYEEVCRRGVGVDGFNALFETPIPWGYYGYKKRRVDGHAENKPTDPQAEVLYPGEISVENLTYIYVPDDDRRALVLAWQNLLGCTDLKVETRPELFQNVAT